MSLGWRHANERYDTQDILSCYKMIWTATSPEDKDQSYADDGKCGDQCPTSYSSLHTIFAEIPGLGSPLKAGLQRADLSSNSKAISRSNALAAGNAVPLPVYKAQTFSNTANYSYSAPYQIADLGQQRGIQQELNISSAPQQVPRLQHSRALGSNAVCILGPILLWHLLEKEANDIGNSLLY